MIKEDLHLHSNFSDGKNSLQEMVEEAIKLGYSRIAFTDHVRRGSDWTSKYLKEFKRVKSKYGRKIRLIVGVEAKVINLNGDLDLPEDLPKEVSFILGSFHKIPKGERIYLEPEEIMADKKKALEYWSRSMFALLINPAVKVLAHPTYILDKYSISLPTVIKQKIAEIAKLNRKIFEINLKHNSPDAEFIFILKKRGVDLVYGSDSHSVREMQQYSKY